MSLEAYQTQVERLVRDQTGHPVFVGSLAQAIVVVEKLFAIALDRIYILTGNLNARVYGTDSVIGQAGRFLADPTHKVRIILEESYERIFMANSFFAILGKYRDLGNLEIRVLSAQYQTKYDFHFMVVDGKSYRFEKNRQEPVAVAAFGDDEGAKNLEGIFDKLWRQAGPLITSERITS